MTDEISSMEKNQVWELVDLPFRLKSVGIKLVLKIKCNVDGSIYKYMTINVDFLEKIFLVGVELESFLNYIEVEEIAESFTQSGCQGGGLHL